VAKYITESPHTKEDGLWSWRTIPEGATGADLVMLSAVAPFSLSPKSNILRGLVFGDRPALNSIVATAFGSGQSRKAEGLNVILNW
jgi:hypothetical protein